MKYIVMCEVYGGVTGHRVSPMKVDGVVMTWNKYEDAEAVAKRQKANVSPFAKATFNYWVKEIEPV